MYNARILTVGNTVNCYECVCYAVGGACYTCKMSLSGTNTVGIVGVHYIRPVAKLDFAKVGAFDYQVNLRTVVPPSAYLRPDARDFQRLFYLADMRQTDVFKGEPLPYAY